MSSKNTKINRNEQPEITNTSIISQQSQERSFNQSNSNRKDSLQEIHFWAYGVGHLINDLTVASWFNFLLYFLKRVAQTPVASLVFFIGQTADGICTPLIGYFSDKYQTRYGKRTPWYIFGFILVAISILPLFIVIKSTYAVEFTYYVGLGVIYSIGWAAVQISHMSLVPSFTQDRQRRDRLNNLRNSFTFAANFIVLGLGLIIFSAIESQQGGLFLITAIGLGLGIAASIFFLWKIKEKELVIKNEIKDKNTQIQVNNGKQNHSNWKWFKMPIFYFFGLCYISMRIYSNVFGTLLPFYLISVLKLGSSDKDKLSFNIALVPLISYLFSAITSSGLNCIYSKLGRKKSLFAGTTICIVSMVMIYFTTEEYAILIYFIAALVGVSQAMVLGTGVNLISQVVGDKGSKGGFVFGVYSFMDKIMVGLIVYLVSNTQQFSKVHELKEAEKIFIKLSIVLICGGCCLFGSLIVLFYPIPQYNTMDDKDKKLIND